MTNPKNTEIQSNDNTIEVLYQKMGDRWFAFSLIDDEVFVGSISQNEILGKTETETPSDRQVMQVYRNSGNT